MARSQLVLNTPNQSEVGDPAFREFLGLLKECLEYHHELADDGFPTSPLGSALRSHFADHLFVHRAELDMLVDRCESKRLILIAGRAGAGKTTVLIRGKRVLEESGKRLFVHYMDLKRKAAEIQAHAIDDAKEEKPLSDLRSLERRPTVCLLMYWDILHKRIQGNAELETAWSIHKVLGHNRYAPIVEAVLTVALTSKDPALDRLREARNRVRSGKGSVDDAEIALWLDHLRDPQIIAMLREFDLEQANDEHLQRLLEFIAVKIGFPVLIFDNIDTYSIGLQSAVVEKCRYVLSPYCTPVVAVRSANLVQIKDRLGRHDDRRAHSQDLDQVENMSTTASTVKLFLEKRLRFLLASEFVKTSPAQLNAFRESMTRFSELKYVSAVLHVLNEWENHSLRHVASIVAEISGRLVAGIDPAYPSRDVLSFADPAIRRTRSFVYKYLICRHHFVYDSDYAVTNVFRADRSLGLMPFPKLVLLRLLARSDAIGSEDDLPRKHATRLKDILRTMSRLGMQKQQTLDLINAMATPPLEEEFGLILVHNRQGFVNADTRSSTVIELLPRGGLLVDVLAMSCEYLFWMGLDTQNDHKLFKHIMYADTASDEARAYVAARFVADYIFPRLKSASRAINDLDDPADARACYDRIFPGGVESVARDAAASIRKFMAGSAEDFGRARKVLDGLDRALS